MNTDNKVKELKEADIKLVQSSHWSMSNKYVTVYRDSVLGIQCECSVKRLDEVRLGKSSESWWIDGVKIQFKSVKDLIRYYNKHNTFISKTTK